MDVSPNDSGTVEVDGSAQCSYPVTYSIEDGVSLNLEAVPEFGYRFANWSGDVTGSENPTRVRVYHNMVITAHFLPDANEFTSEDEMLSIIFPVGTIALDGEENPIANIEFTVNETPPLPQEGDIVGLAYNLEPSGATFDPPATLTWYYEPLDIPSGVGEEGLVIAYYDEALVKWVELESELDWANIAIRALVDHLSTFAILAPTAPPTPATFTTSSLSISPLEVNIGEPVSISALLTNTGEEEGIGSVTLKINGVIEETKNSKTLAGGASETVAFTIYKYEAGAYSVDVNGLTDLDSLFMVSESALPPVTTPPPAAPASKISWAILGPIMAAVFLAIFLPIRIMRKRRDSTWY